MSASSVSLQTSKFAFWAAKREPTGWTLRTPDSPVLTPRKTANNLFFGDHDIYLSMFVALFFLIDAT
jgi:hypothetical protein